MSLQAKKPTIKPQDKATRSNQQRSFLATCPNESKVFATGIPSFLLWPKAVILWGGIVKFPCGSTGAVMCLCRREVARAWGGATVLDGGLRSTLGRRVGTRL